VRAAEAIFNHAAKAIDIEDIDARELRSGMGGIRGSSRARSGPARALGPGASQRIDVLFVGPYPEQKKTSKL
jgi:hypothetical protein